MTICFNHDIEVLYKVESSLLIKVHDWFNLGKLSLSLNKTNFVFTIVDF